VGTSSQRRLAQLKSGRHDLVVNDLRGNVDTRIRKLDEGQYDALILASAGLKRLGLGDRISYSISFEEMLPAVGQGAIGIETRKDDEFTVQTVMRLDHESTRIACLAERALLRSLGGGCQFPIAAHATFVEGALKLDALVASPDGFTILKSSLSGSANEPEQLGISVANKLKEKGAESLLKQH
jgi:hydroxymethylbilane synthase